MRLTKVYSCQENNKAQAEDEHYCEYPEGVSWQGKMSAAWEVVEIPGLAISSEPPANEHQPQCMAWQVWMHGDQGGQDFELGYKISRQLRAQRFASRREALQAIKMAARLGQADATV